MQIYRVDEKEEYYFKEGCHILELLNSEEDRQVSIARASVKPGVTTKLHRLKDTTERYLILSGIGRVEVNSEVDEIGEGAVLVIPPGATQRITNIGQDELVFLAICSPRFVVENYQQLED